MIGIVFLIASCGIPQAENESLTKKLEECKFGADKLLAEANSLLENKEYRLAQLKADGLIKRYPNSPEAKKGKDIVAKSISGIKQLEQVKKDRLTNATKKMRRHMVSGQDVSAVC